MHGSSPQEMLSERAMNTTALFPGEPFHATRLLDAGHSASARLQWFNWCNPGTTARPTSTAVEGRRPSQVLVTVAAGAHGIVATVKGGLQALYLPVCFAPQQPSRLYVSLWTAGS
jgi:hypothetical protein